MSSIDYQLFSALAGLIGSLLSALSTYGFEPAPLAECCDISENDIVNNKNKLRRKGQIVGLLLIALSFLLQIVSLN